MIGKGWGVNGEKWCDGGGAMGRMRVCGLMDKFIRKIFGNRLVYGWMDG